MKDKELLPALAPPCFAGELPPSVMNPKQPRLAIFVSFTGKGGVERVVFNLLQGLSVHDLLVDLLVVVSKNAVLPETSWPNVRVIRLKAKHTASALPALAAYLRRERPDVLMAAKDRCVRVAVMARRLARGETKLVGQMHMNLMGVLKHKTAWQRWLRCAGMRWSFPHLHLIIGVSEGVVEDTVEITGLPRERMVALPNPIIDRELYEKSEQPVDDPWLNDPSVPVVLGVGRLNPQKDFPTLIRAFHLVRQEKECRLIILGEGSLLGELEKLISDLGLQHCAALRGHTDNPYTYMKKAAVFALSSVGEGSPTVLVEAMALGTPVVSTDCPSGPRETLEGGKFGPLVPVGDPEKLAAAIVETLRAPLPASVLQQAVEKFSIEQSTRSYLEALGFLPPSPGDKPETAAG